MHSISDASSGAVPAFLGKLWALVEDEATDSMICWDPSGSSFHLLDQGRLAKEVLPLYFKHNNISSFIRQLNMYGFRKVMHMGQGGLKIEKDDMEFKHQYFQRDMPHLLDRIKRNVTSLKTNEVRIKQDDVGLVLGEVKSVQEKQEKMTNKLETLKRENEALWREVASLRQKHNKQQQIVNKLIQFLVTMVGTNRNVGPLKRKLPMLNDGSQLQPPKPKLSRQLSIEKKPGTTLPSSNNVPAAKGPTIFDITDTPDAGISEPFTLPTMAAASPDVTEPSSVESLDTSGQLDMAPTVDVSGGEMGDAALWNSIQKPTDQAPGFTVTGAEKPESLSSPSSSGDQQHLAVLPRLSPSRYRSHRESKIHSPKDNHRVEVLDHVELTQSDLDNIKDLLSSGTYQLDSSIVHGLFAPEAPLPHTPDHLLDWMSEKPVFPGQVEETASTTETTTLNTPGTESGELALYSRPDFLEMFDTGTGLLNPPAEDLTSGNESVSTGLAMPDFLEQDKDVGSTLLSDHLD